MRWYLAIICCLIAGCGQAPPQPVGPFATPQAVFNTAQLAANEKDVPRILECHSPEMVDGMTAHTILAAAMMRTVADGFSKQGDDRYVAAKQRVDAVLQKYSVDISQIQSQDLPPNAPNLTRRRELAQKIPDRLKFLAELLTELEAAKGTETTGFQDELTGELVDLRVRGDLAEAEVKRIENGVAIRKPISFRKSAGGWRIHMPTE